MPISHCSHASVKSQPLVRAHTLSAIETPASFSPLSVGAQSSKTIKLLFTFLYMQSCLIHASLFTMIILGKKFECRSTCVDVNNIDILVQVILQDNTKNAD
jgi:hypothetical protein